MDGRHNLANSQSSQSGEGRVVDDNITSPKQHCKPASLTKARVCVVWGMLQRWQDEEQIRQRVAQVKLQLRRVNVAETTAAWSKNRRIEILVPQQLTNQLRPKRESESLGTCFIGGKQIAAVRIPWKCESRPGMGGKQMPLH